MSAFLGGTEKHIQIGAMMLDHVEIGGGSLPSPPIQVTATLVMNHKLVRQPNDYHLKEAVQNKPVRVQETITCATIP